MVAFNQADLELRARRRADMENSNFVSSDEVTTLVEKAWEELYLKVVSQYPMMVMNAGPDPATISPSTTSRVEMPTNFLKLEALLLTDSSGRPVHFLRPINSVRELEPFLVGAVSFNGRSGVPTHYYFYARPDGAPASAEVYPYPDTTYTVQIYFIPLIPLSTVEFSNGMAWLAGWDEYIVITAAIKMKDKEESDCTVLMAERSQLWESMVRQITPLDMSEPTQVVAHRTNRGFVQTRDPYDAEGTF